MMTIITLLPLIGFLATGLASPTCHVKHVGANYFMTNNFHGNQLVSSYILPNGHLRAGSAIWTGGNGSAGINDPDPFENHPDPLYSSSSVIVAGTQVMVVNAGSNSFSVFDIDSSDPGIPSLRATYPSKGDFPVSLAASPDGNYVCVLRSGTDNGFSCYQNAGDGEWAYLPQWDRSLGLNLTTPPHGPVGGTPSQLLFASDMRQLKVVVKGRVPTDLNNPTGALQEGYVATFSIDNATLAAEAVHTAATVPFSINEDIDNPDLFFMSDVTTGYAVLNETAGSVVQGIIPNQAAACWAAQSNVTRHFYVVEAVGKSNITEVSIDPITSQGTVISSHSLGLNASGTDLSIFARGKTDWVYVNAPAYQSVHVFEISGPGKFKLIQRYDLCDVDGINLSTGSAGQAVYYG